MPERSSNTLLNAGMIFLVLTGGFLLIQQPIKSLRPQGNTGIERQSLTKQSSRLWQDPFESARPVQKSQGETNVSDTSLNGNYSSDSENIFREILWEQLLGSEGDFLLDKESVDYNPEKVALNRNEVMNALNNFRVLAVMVPGKPYQDQVERRIRYRVALVHGMLKAGYHPSDAENIGHLMFLSDTSKNSSKYDEIRDLWKSKVEQTIPVPYEWYQHESKENVLVLWINEDRFASAPLMLLNLLFNHIDDVRKEAYRTRFPTTLQNLQNVFSRYDVYCRLFDSFAPPLPVPLNVLFHNIDDAAHKFFAGKSGGTQDFNSLTFQIIGPYSSTTLHRIRDESKLYSQIETARKLFRTDSTFYNYSATSQEKGQREEFWVRSGRVYTEKLLKDDVSISMHHLVSSDAMLMQAMHRELKLRNWTLKSSSPKDIILLSENDTVYGRTLPEAFEGVSKYVYKGEYECYRYGYLRGIDGTTAADAQAQEQKRISGMQSLASEKGSAQLPSRLLPGKPTNPPVGNNQLDYIARLIMEIKQNHPRPFAMGILGSDPYDKLMLLQSLRLHFPDTLFFTTDLEAQYLDLESVHTAHGLLVASSYGLALHPNIQKNTPPFRGTYQTALFHAVLAAIDDKKTKDKNNDKTIEEDENSFLKQQSLPRVFEIGWYNAVDLTMESQEKQKNYYKSLTNFHWDRYNYSETWKELHEQNPIMYENNEDEEASLHPFSPRLTKGWKEFFAKYAWLVTIILLPIVVLITVNFKLVCNVVLGEWLKKLFPDKTKDKKKQKRTWRKINIALIALLFGMILYIYWVIHYNHTNPLIGGEPLFLWEGNSYWPILFAQFLVIYLGIIFLFVALRIFQKVRLDVSNIIFPKKVEENALEKIPSLDIREYITSLASIIPHVLSWKKETKEGAKQSNSSSDSNNNQSLWELWSEYLQKSKQRFDDIRIGMFLVFLCSVLFFGFMFYHTDWTTFRGDGRYFGMSAAFIGMFCAFTMLNVLTGIIAASSIFGVQFVTEITETKDSLLKDTGKPFSLDHSDHFRIVKLIGEWTHTTQSIIWFPVILLLILTVARIFVFENFGRGEIIRLCYVVAITLLIFVPVWKLRAKARNLRHGLVDDLKSKLVISQASDGTKTKQKIITAEEQIWTLNSEQIKIVVKEDAEQSLTANPEQIKIVIEEIEKYQKGIYSNNFWYPVVSVLVVLSGGVSSPLLWEFFFK